MIKNDCKKDTKKDAKKDIKKDTRKDIKKDSKISVQKKCHRCLVDHLISEFLRSQKIRKKNLERPNRNLVTQIQTIKFKREFILFEIFEKFKL